MLPKIGDRVQFTSEFLNASASSKKSKFEGKELEILKVNLKSLSNSGSTYDVFYRGDMSMGKEENLNKNGCKTIDGVSINVFETCGDSSSSTSKPAVDEGNKCKCGTMGEMVGMACKCPDCGTVIWGI
jgi:hypothetical protein